MKRRRPSLTVRDAETGAKVRIYKPTEEKGNWAACDDAGALIALFPSRELAARFFDPQILEKGCDTLATTPRRAIARLRVKCQELGLEVWDDEDARCIRVDPPSGMIIDGDHQMIGIYGEGAIDIVKGGSKDDACEDLLSRIEQPIPCEVDGCVVCER